LTDQTAGPAPQVELVVPFSVSAETIDERVRHFARGFFFEPAELTPETLKSRLQRLFVPVWLVDADVDALWQAEVGYDYEVVSHQEAFQHGSWVTQEVTEVRVRWEPRVGKLDRHYANVPVPALQEQRAIEKRLGRFSAENAISSQSDALSNALVRLPNVVPDHAWPEAEPVLLQSAESDCQQAAVAQHIRQFKWQPNYAKKTWTLLLIPLLSTYYRDDDGNALPLLINGRTGQLFGIRRASMARAKRLSLIAAAVGALLLLLALILTLLDVAAAATGIALLGVLIALSAIYPVAYAHQLNSKPIRPFWQSAVER
jgi:hypothetical protein